MTRESRAELEEARIMETMHRTCRNHDTILEAEFSPPEEDGITPGDLKYYRGGVARLRARVFMVLHACALSAIVIAQFTKANEFVEIALWWAAAIFFVAAIKARFTKPIAVATLNRLIDADLIAAGYRVEFTEGCRRVTIPPPTEGDE